MSFEIPTQALFKYLKVILCIFAGVLLTAVECFANDGLPATTGRAPVAYYEGIMVAVAVSYSLFLIWRARKRKRVVKDFRESNVENRV